MKCTECGHPKPKVLETRVHPQWSYLVRRRYVCPACGRRFSTMEISEGLAGTLKKYLTAHNRGIQQRVALHHRDQQIVARMYAGEKYTAIAHDFGISDTTLNYIARKYGVPPKRKKLDIGEKPQEN